MELLIIVLNKVEYLKDMLSIMVEAGITEATILDSEGMGQILAYEVPIFAGLRQLLGEERAHNKTVFALIKKGEVFEDFKKLLKEVDIDFAQKGTGIAFTVPVNSFMQPEKDS